MNSMTRLRNLLLLSLLLSGTFSAVAAEIADPRDKSLSGSARLEALIERIKGAQGDLETLEARFVQHQESALLLEPEESSGTFQFAAPDQVRWEYTDPTPISVVIDGKSMTTWYRDLGRAETLEVGRYSSQIFKYLGASGSMETLLDYFDVNVRFPSDGADPYALVMKPRYSRIAKKLESMTLWVDAEAYLPVRLRYVGADGDSTEYRFENLKINQGIPAERFELDLNEEVDVQRIDLPRSG
ncbi:MAG: outer membrane lipoprotein carrier protein LolA [Acidobacteriota bacterium]